MKKLKMDEMGRLTGQAFRESSKMNLTIVLDNVRSMMNVGAIFRTADAFRAKQICLCGITATPPHREIHKTALGATESVEWEYYHDTVKLIRSLSESGAVIVAVEQTDESTTLENWRPDPEKHLVLVFGNEVSGVSDEVLALCDYSIEIPQYGTKHSLNIAVSAGIMIWESYKRFRHQLT